MNKVDTLRQALAVMADPWQEEQVRWRMLRLVLEEFMLAKGVDIDAKLKDVVATCETCGTEGCSLRGDKEMSGCHCWTPK